jgi:hypothetical protein
MPKRKTKVKIGKTGWGRGYTEGKANIGRK